VQHDCVGRLNETAMTFMQKPSMSGTTAYLSGARKTARRLQERRTVFAGYHCNGLKVGADDTADIEIIFQAFS
jgi:hypothetical protein